MDEIKINKDKVTHIIVNDKKLLKYRYLPKKVVKHFGIKLNEYVAGYYKYGQYSHTEICLSQEYVNKSNAYQDNDGQLYQNPNIEIYINDNLLVCKHFDTIDECRKFCLETFPHLTVTVK